MNWPEDLEDIECVGFSFGLLHRLVKAWDNHEVNILPGRSRRSSTDCSWLFDHGGFRYQIDCEEGSEIRDDGRLWSITTPYRVERIGKLGIVSNEGEVGVTEHYPITNPQQASITPKYVGQWGAF